MARRLSWILISLLPAGCSGPAPSAADVPAAAAIDRIEQQLAGDPCIGPPDRWERHFYYALAPGGSGPATRTDRNIIAFDFYEAGRYEFLPRRVVSAVPDVSPDDRPMRVAFGAYHVASDRLSVDFCGQNTAPPGQVVRDPGNAAAWSKP